MTPPPPPPPPPPAASTAAGNAFAPPPTAERQGAWVAVPSRFWRKAFAFAGPGYLVAVGYMDPGNWATGLGGGSAFGYQLLSVIVLSNLLAMFLQALAAKLGIVSGLDLAQACRARYRRPTRLFLWLLCELAIAACDLAELIGAAIALELLFGVPLLLGIVLTGFEVLLILMLHERGVRALEALVAGLIAVIALCFAAELILAQPSGRAIVDGLVPTAAIVADPAMLYLAIGILGATVMPHNLYLHSALVKSRRHRRDEPALREAIRFAVADVVIALAIALFINASILVLAAATFHQPGVGLVVGIEEAYRLLAPALGAGIASTLFAVALLASGQNASITGTLAGQVAMEGFTDLRWPPWLRRLVSRLAAMVPALVAVGLHGNEGAMQLLILSQVVLSLQLPFAVVPLVRLTGDRSIMGAFANGPVTTAVAWLVSGLLIALNLVLLGQSVT